MSLGSGRKERLERNRSQPEEKSVREREKNRAGKDIKDDVGSLHLLLDLRPKFLFVVVFFNSLWSYSKALAGREIYPFCLSESPESPGRAPRGGWKAERQERT